MCKCSVVPYIKLPSPILNPKNSFVIVIIWENYLDGIVFSMLFRRVRDLKSQDLLVDSKMMVESKGVTVVTLLMVWKLIKCPQSRRTKKSAI